VAAVAAMALLTGGCGDDGADERAARESIDAINRAVGRVEARAEASTGPAARRARATRLVFENWWAQHSAVFAVDPQAARGRVRAVLEDLAAISPSLVTRDAAGAPADPDDEAIARILMPDAGTRRLARRERRVIERELSALSETLEGEPASTVLAGEAGQPGSATADDLLIDLQQRLRLLYPDLAAHVLELRVDLPR
jgi:hypothetical protein